MKIVPKAVFAVLLLLVGLIFVFRTNSVDKIASFKNEPVSVEGFVLKEFDESKIPARIIISELGIDLPVEKARLINGYWEVFEDKAGWGEGSGVSGISGNQVIFAHAREGLFMNLQDITTNTMVEITNKSDEKFAYVVTEITEVTPDNVSVIAPTEDETLTLYTCSGFLDRKRLIIKAKPINSVVAAKLN